MGTRKGYPFSRRAHKQGLGFLTKSIIGLLGAGAYAADGIKKAVEDNTAPVKAENKKDGDTSDVAVTILFIVMAVVFVGVVLIVLAPLISLLAPILAVGILSSIAGVFTKK